MKIIICLVLFLALMPALYSQKLLPPSFTSERGETVFNFEKMVTIALAGIKKNSDELKNTRITVYSKDNGQIESVAIDIPNIVSVAYAKVDAITYEHYPAVEGEPNLKISLLLSDKDAQYLVFEYDSPSMAFPNTVTVQRKKNGKTDLFKLYQKRK